MFKLWMANVVATLAITTGWLYALYAAIFCAELLQKPVLCSKTSLHVHIFVIKGCKHAAGPYM